MNQKTTSPAITRAMRVPAPTDRMPNACDMAFSPRKPSLRSRMRRAQYIRRRAGFRAPGTPVRGVVLLEEGLAQELDGRTEEEVGIRLLHEAVSFVLREDEPHRRPAALEALDDLPRLALRHALAVRALRHEEGLYDALDVSEARDRFQELAHGRIALVAVLDAP